MSRNDALKYYILLDMSGKENSFQIFARHVRQRDILLDMSGREIFCWTCPAKRYFSGHVWQRDILLDMSGKENFFKYFAGHVRQRDILLGMSSRERFCWTLSDREIFCWICLAKRIFLNIVLDMSGRENFKNILLNFLNILPDIVRQRDILLDTFLLPMIGFEGLMVPSSILVDLARL